jgi:hypothetical protein
MRAVFFFVIVALSTWINGSVNSTAWVKFPDGECFDSPCSPATRVRSDVAQQDKMETVRQQATRFPDPLDADSASNL